MIDVTPRRAPSGAGTIPAGGSAQPFRDIGELYPDWAGGSRLD
jgi:hypothetical protein